MNTATTKPEKSLVPARGTNPERQKAPKAPLLDFFREQGGVCPELAYITSLAVGHAVGIYWGTKCLFGTKKEVYQVMRWDESKGPGYEFWRHQIIDRPQWYDTPEKACAAYVASYHEWQKIHPEEPAKATRSSQGNIHEHSYNPGDRDFV